MNRDDHQIATAMAEELLAKEEPMELVMIPLTVLRLTGLVQLALRHPSMAEAGRDAGERFVRAARQYFADCPTVLDVIRRGDDPAEDRPFRART